MKLVFEKSRPGHASVILPPLDVEKMELIIFDPASHAYRLVGPVVGHAYHDGKQLMK